MSHVALPRRRALLVTAASAGLALPALTLSRHVWAQESRPALDVPYVPTPQHIVDKMLQMARVGREDVLFDLGCGDGRIVVTAAQRWGTRGTGIDLNPDRIHEAEANALKAGVQEHTRFQVANLFDTDVSSASVVTLYLLRGVNIQLRPRLWQQLPVGARVVSHAFDMGSEWPPERTERVDQRSIFAWTIRPEHKRVL